jgi:hypothetical protein
VYGVPSIPHSPKRRRLTTGHLEEYPVIKTHHLPEDLPPFLQELPAVYLVRDFRDCIVSSAHKRRRKEGATAPSFHRCLVEIILAPKHTHFGGWSHNVRQWLAKVDIVIKFEHLVKHPLREVEKVRGIMDLPPADAERLPTFEYLKSGKGKYPVYKNEEEAKLKAKRFFRKGKIGGWKEEIPPLIFALLINFHGDTLKDMGYDLYPEGYGHYRFFKHFLGKKMLEYYFRGLMAVSWI